jgi:bifunctional DNA-binding transcriptional regulator/antitoxin component of YhaV-PrlF toxin-antitoxin module
MKHIQAIFSGIIGALWLWAALRRQLAIEPGSLLEVRAVGDHLELYPLPRDPISAFRGSLKAGRSLAQELIEEHREELRHDAEH